MNEVFSSLFQNAGPVGCIIIGCVALTAVGCFAVYMIINKKMKTSEKKNSDTLEAVVQKMKEKQAVFDRDLREVRIDLEKGSEQFRLFDEKLSKFAERIGDRFTELSNGFEKLSGKFDMLIELKKKE